MNGIMVFCDRNWIIGQEIKNDEHAPGFYDLKTAGPL